MGATRKRGGVRVAIAVTALVAACQATRSAAAQQIQAVLAC